MKLSRIVPEMIFIQTESRQSIFFAKSVSQWFYEKDKMLEETLLLKYIKVELSPNVLTTAGTANAQRAQRYVGFRLFIVAAVIFRCVRCG
ncbi:MAG: hypothetical protein JJU13_07160 [Balneolaceae bacterium]|nr:hypothetical protein [Balneolaceae bacterium]